MEDATLFETIVIYSGFLIAFIVVFLIMRGVYLWYFRINEIYDLLERQTNALEQMAGLKRPLEPKRTESEWKCPKCDNINPNSSLICEKCEYSLK